MQTQIAKTERVVKDLYFLLDIKEEQIEPNIYKYPLEQGTGPQLGEIKLPCTIYITFTSYDYSGKFVNKFQNVALKHPHQKLDRVVSAGVRRAVMNMKLKEKSWFNIVGAELHGTSGLSDKGCHFQITVEAIKYQNSDDIESKRLVEQQNREQAKNLFGQKSYEQAMRKYRLIINISQGLEKGKYSNQETNELAQMNLRAKSNFLKCYLKIEFEDQKTAEAYSQQLLEADENDVNLRIQTQLLIKHRKRTDSLEYAKKLYTKYPNAENRAFMLEISEKISK